MATPTRSQLTALEGLIHDARREHAVEVNPWSPAFPWLTQYSEETRAGRGHDLAAVWMDGEHAVHIRLDPYGNGSVEIWRTELLHASADEECPCRSCAAWRDGAVI